MTVEKDRGAQNDEGVRVTNQNNEPPKPLEETPLKDEKVLVRLDKNAKQKPVKYWTTIRLELFQLLISGDLPGRIFANKLTLDHHPAVECFASVRLHP